MSGEPVTRSIALALAGMIGFSVAVFLAALRAPAPPELQPLRAPALEMIGATQYGGVYYFRHEGRSCYVYESGSTATPGSISCVDGREK